MKQLVYSTLLLSCVCFGAFAEDAPSGRKLFAAEKWYTDTQAAETSLDGVLKKEASPMATSGRFNPVRLLADGKTEVEVYLGAETGVLDALVGRSVRITGKRQTVLGHDEIWPAAIQPVASPAPIPVTPASVVAPATATARPLVQLAVLLDTSSSMDGMIKQAQTQLWSIVNEFATAKQEGKSPILQVALYQYGTPSLGVANGYIRQVLPLTDDLDKVSEALFALKSNGGDEYCGWVIQEATQKLDWSPSAKDYKAIFIAGNEPFNQGKVDFREACKAAVTKGIIVNTIHCAGAEDTHWKDAAALADGKFLKIDGNRTVVEVTAPQDVEIAKLNVALNQTYIAFGHNGREKAERQMAGDAASGTISSANYAARAVSKSSAQYRNTDWDMVDAVKEKKVNLAEIKDEELPKSMQGMSADERAAYVAGKEKERAEVQAKIQALAKERDAFVAAAMKKNANQDTLGEQVKSTIRTQASQRGFSFAP